MNYTRQNGVDKPKTHCTVADMNNELTQLTKFLKEHYKGAFLTEEAFLEISSKRYDIDAYSRDDIMRDIDNILSEVSLNESAGRVDNVEIQPLDNRSFRVILLSTDMTNSIPTQPNEKLTQLLNMIKKSGIGTIGQGTIIPLSDMNSDLEDLEAMTIELDILDKATRLVQQLENYKTVHAASALTKKHIDAVVKIYINQLLNLE